MTETTPNIKERVAATAPKTPRSRAKSTAHDGDAKASASSKKAAISASIDAVTAKAIADAQALAQETYANAFLGELSNQKRAFEALSFDTIQGKARQKTAHILKPVQQLQLTGAISEEAESAETIIPCEAWLAWEDEV